MSKLTCLFLLIGFMEVSATGYSQNMVSVDFKDAKISKVLRYLEKKSDYIFYYNNEELKDLPGVSIYMKEVTVPKVLDSLSKTSSLIYDILNNNLVVVRKQGSEASLQLQSIHGTVTDSSGNPLVGVTVRVKGTSIGTITDAQGHYQINTSQNAALVFSFIGYQNKEVLVDGKETVNVTLFATTAGLNQLVVVGYQSETKRDLTSSVVSVSGKDLNKRVAINPATLLQGKLPGLSVTQNSGQPGSEGVQLLVRGIGTFSGAGVNPLIIVNGIPGSLTDLNPNDIASITVLKDAASAAIYGSRGANGVIVITTKQGQKGGGFSLSYSYDLGITSATKLPQIINNSAAYMELFNEARTNSNLQPIYTQQQIDLYKNATDRKEYPNFNWLNAIFQTAYTQNHYLNMSGGNGNTNYSLGLGFNDQPGVMIGFTYKKYTLSFGLNSKINKRITLGTHINMNYNNQLSPEDGAQDFFLSALAQSPLYTPRLSNGDWIDKAYSDELNNKNPVALVGNDIRTRVNDYFMQGDLSLGVDIIDGLKWEGKIGVNYDASDNNNFRKVIPLYLFSDTSFSKDLDDGSPGLSVGRSSEVYLVAYNQLTYNKQLGNSNISALAGYQQEHDQTSSLTGSRAGAFTTNLLRELNAGPTTNETNSGTSADWGIRSYYGNVHYNYKDKYLIGGSVRYDGTSRLPADTRWGLFYAFSGGWRISSESFLKDVSWLNDLKIRSSWGRLGNQNIGTYPYQPTLSVHDYPFNGTVQTGLAASALIDPALTWETTQVFDAGVDITAFNHTLTLTADWYNKYTFNILRGSQVPYWLGLSAPTVNNGAVRNKGIEVDIQYKNTIGGNFTYYISGNVQTFRNTLVHFGQNAISGTSIMAEGHEMNEYYLYVWDGIFQSQDEIDKSPAQPVTPSPGDLKYKDVNGDGVINASDRTFVKGMYPAYQYSFNLGGSYKGIDLSVQLYGSQGQKIYVTGWGIQPFRQGSVPTTAWLNAWTAQNHSTTMPRIYDADSYPAINSYPSTYFLKNASFMRIKNINVGYTIPSFLTRKIGMRSARIYFDGVNLFTFSKYPGLDPERVGGGNYVNYPQNKVFNFGIMVKF